MKKGIKYTALVLGLLTAFSAGISAATYLEPVTAYLNPSVTVKYNNQPQTMRDARGDIVVPLTYNDSTYLPVRAISNMLGVAVDWDDATKTVYLGEHPSTISTPTTNPNLQPPIIDCPSNSTELRRYSDAPVTNCLLLPTGANVPTEVTEPLLNLSFVTSVMEEVAGDNVKFDKVSAQNVKDNSWIGTEYEGLFSNSPVSYTFPALDIVPSNGSRKGTKEIGEIQSIIETNLVNAGYKLIETTSVGQKFYSYGDIEISVWNINNENNTLELRLTTGFQNRYAK